MYTTNAETFFDKFLAESHMPDNLEKECVPQGLCWFVDGLMELPDPETMWKEYLEPFDEGLTVPVETETTKDIVSQCNLWGSACQEVESCEVDEESLIWEIGLGKNATTTDILYAFRSINSGTLMVGRVEEGVLVQLIDTCSLLIQATYSPEFVYVDSVRYEAGQERAVFFKEAHEEMPCLSPWKFTTVRGDSLAGMQAEALEVFNSIVSPNQLWAVYLLCDERRFIIETYSLIEEGVKLAYAEILSTSYIDLEDEAAQATNPFHMAVFWQ